MSGTQAVDRAAMLVATVVRAPEPVPFADLVEVCDLPKSTASRILTALERTELVVRHQAGGYVAGPLFSEYATKHDPWEELAALALPVLTTVGDESGETVNLAVPRGHRVRHIAQVDSRFLLGTRDWTVVEVPPHTSALGKVLHAYDALPLPAGPLAAVTEHSVTDVDAFVTQLKQIRRRGYAATVDELEVGLCGVAVPVRSDDGDVVAALGIYGPTARLADRIAPVAALLTTNSKRITSLLGKVGAA